MPRGRGRTHRLAVQTPGRDARAMLHLLHDDTALIAAAKPEGLATVPERQAPEHCLRARLKRQGGARLLSVHRLDKPVSGVVVFARTPEAHRALSRQFEMHSARKTYLALVQGAMAADDGGR